MILADLTLKDEMVDGALSGLQLSGPVYYAVCAVLFTLAGLISGYFIWRKGHMQMQDAEDEVRKTRDELEKLRDDMKVEESGL